RHGRRVPRLCAGPRGGLWSNGGCRSTPPDRTHGHAVVLVLDYLRDPAVWCHGGRRLGL
ncbi:uncharacterized protein METZ01_LOCUS516811, partial [marine metagenome]